jgi:hypothetical protein
VTIKRDINKLIPPRVRGKKRLAPLAGSRSIGASRGIGKLTASAIRTERRTLLSSDGIFSLDYYHVLGTSGS